MMIHLYNWYNWKNNEAREKAVESSFFGITPSNLISDEVQKEWDSKNILTREDIAECKSCGGRGWNYFGFKVFGDCEVCNGAGVVNYENNKPHYKYNWKLNKAELVR